jgi:hypothetical protein
VERIGKPSGRKLEGKVELQATEYLAARAGHWSCAKRAPTWNCAGIDRHASAIRAARLQLAPAIT